MDHLYGSTVLIPYIKSLGLRDFAIASPDIGGAKRANSWAKYFDSGLIICHKTRIRANEVADMKVIGDVEGKNIIVVPSKTVPQGITAIIHCVPDMTPEENKANMIEEMSRVKTGQITYAVRNTVIDDKEISEGDIMGIADKGIVAVGKEVEDTALETIKTMLDDESELVTVYYGADVTEEKAEGFLEKVQEICGDCDVELQFGGQPIYYYLISVE